VARARSSVRPTVSLEGRGHASRPSRDAPRLIPAPSAALRSGSLSGSDEDEDEDEDEDSDALTSIDVPVGMWVRARPFFRLAPVPGLRPTRRSSPILFVLAPGL
jgi:hypothetical protein